MAYKQKGFPMHSTSSALKQLKPEYKRSPEEKAFYESPESKDYEPVPGGTYKGPGHYSKYTGPDVIEEGTFGPRVVKKAGDVEPHGVGWSTEEEFTGPVKPGGDEAMYAEIDALGKRPNRYTDREGHDAWMEKMEAIESGYGE